jgi:hypothetical protein
VKQALRLLHFLIDLVIRIRIVRIFDNPPSISKFHIPDARLSLWIEIYHSCVWCGVGGIQILQNAETSRDVYLPKETAAENQGKDTQVLRDSLPVHFLCGNL